MASFGTNLDPSNTSPRACPALRDFASTTWRFPSTATPLAPDHPSTLDCWRHDSRSLARHLPPVAPQQLAHPSCGRESAPTLVFEVGHPSIHAIHSPIILASTNRQ